MEATSHPVFKPISDFDRRILSIMDKLGWGVTVSKLSEYADVDPQAVQSSLNWLSEQGLVEAHQHEEYGWLCWYRTEQSSASVCPICGKHCCNAHGLAIHQARKHHDKVGAPTVFIANDVEKPEQHDYMSMDLEPRTLNFVQDIIKRFADLPGVSIRVTVEFKGAGA